jgi:uncharacterized metal-binding protein YceD (DUF177 family)
MTHISEFPHLVAAAKIGPEPTEVSFSANERQRALLAKRYSILSVDLVEGSAKLKREGDGMTIHVSGHFRAKVSQACVTTLEPVHDDIAETFEGWFLDESQAASFIRAKKRKEEEEGLITDLLPALEDEETLVTEERDEPEAVVNGMVDVGELVAQHLSLALNPFPHSENALETGPLGDDQPLAKESPFAALKDLKIPGK